MKLKQLMALAAIVTPSLSFAYTIDMGSTDYSYGGTANFGVQLSQPSSDPVNIKVAPETYAIVLTDPGPGVSVITNPQVITANIVGSVPEPSTWALFLLGLIGVSLVTKRKEAKATDSPAPY
jgi:hypothetical protein